MEKINDLFRAAREGNADEVSSILKNNPAIDINHQSEAGYNALHSASIFGYAEVVKLLLEHPNIDVNRNYNDGRTAFSFSCAITSVSVSEVLIKDPRVDVTLADDKGRTPLWWASCYGMLKTVECIIASGRDLGDVKNDMGADGWDGKNYTTLEIARKFKKTKVVTLLKGFLANPSWTRHELRTKLGLFDELAAGVFALIVFLCDDLLQLKEVVVEQSKKFDNSVRFFSIAKTLPMEIQMLLCHRVVGSMKQNVLSNDSEPAFKALAKNIILVK